MNDLSSLSYVELKKQAMEDKEFDRDDLGKGQSDTLDEQNSKLFEDVTLIKNDMEEMTNLVLALKDLNEEAKTINLDMAIIVKKVASIKSRLESLCEIYEEASHVDRTRISITNGLRDKLREMVIDFQSLQKQIVEMEIDSERQEEIERSLTELHFLFVDMAVFLETQRDNIDNVEHNVAQGDVHVNGGTNGLFYVLQMKKTRSNWAFWIGALVILLLLAWIIVS